jgi:hypothetical protein
MSNYGCPESESRGWTQSVLDMRMKKRQRNKKLKLCVKVRHDTELDTESWIPGNYTIYKIGENCPIGFIFFYFIDDNKLHILRCLFHIPYVMKLVL